MGGGGRKSGAPDRLVFLCILVMVIHWGITGIVCMEFPNNGMYESKKQSWGFFCKTNIPHIYRFLYYTPFYKTRFDGWMEKSEK
jgi:hypothetical protein